MERRDVRDDDADAVLAEVRAEHVAAGRANHVVLAHVREARIVPVRQAEVAHALEPVAVARRHAAAMADPVVQVAQLDVEDGRLGVPEYVIEKLGIEFFELKWGQGAKNIGGEVKLPSMERALELKKRGYLI